MNSKITHLRKGKVIRQLDTGKDTVYDSINEAKGASRLLPFGTLRVVDVFPATQQERKEPVVMDFDHAEPALVEAAAKLLGA